MKQAIGFNFAGSAKNELNGTVHFMLKGDSDRLDAALVVIRAGTKKSSNIEVSTNRTAVDPRLSTFTIIDWTSTSRIIVTPYTLVFTPRADDKTAFRIGDQRVWRQILPTTLLGKDAQKLSEDD